MDKDILVALILAGASRHDNFTLSLSLILSLRPPVRSLPPPPFLYLSLSSLSTQTHKHYTHVCVSVYIYPPWPMNFSIITCYEFILLRKYTYMYAYLCQMFKLQTSKWTKPPNYIYCVHHSDRRAPCTLVHQSDAPLTPIDLARFLPGPVLVCAREC